MFSFKSNKKIKSHTYNLFRLDTCFEIYANSADPVQTSQNTASDQMLAYRNFHANYSKREQRIFYVFIGDRIKASFPIENSLKSCRIPKLCNLHLQFSFPNDPFFASFRKKDPE